MNISEKLKKYTVTDEDWAGDFGIVELKMQAQSVISLFGVLGNTLAEIISPAETELIDETESKLLKYLDDRISDDFSVSP